MQTKNLPPALSPVRIVRAVVAGWLIATPVSHADVVLDPDWMRTSNARIEDDTLRDTDGNVVGWTVGSTAYPVNDPGWTWTSLVWDGPATNPDGNSGWPTDYWAYWGHETVGDCPTADAVAKRWFRTTVTVCGAESVQEIRLVDKYPMGGATSPVLSINDDLFVYVNGIPVAAGGTGVSASGGTLDAAWSGLYRDAVFENYGSSPATGWFIPGGLSLPAWAFHSGANEVSILTDEYCGWGGLGHPVFHFSGGGSAVSDLIWHPPLAESPEPLEFKRGRVLPVRVHAVGCDGTAAPIQVLTGILEVMADDELDGIPDGDPIAIARKGSGAPGLMVPGGNSLMYNLDTGGLPQESSGYLIRVEIGDTESGVSKTETIRIRLR